MSRETNKSLLFGAISGITFGWIARTFISQRGALMEKLKRIDRRIYEDGSAKATKINQLKQDIHEKIEINDKDKDAT